MRVNTIKIQTSTDCFEKMLAFIKNLLIYKMAQNTLQECEQMNFDTNDHQEMKMMNIKNYLQESRKFYCQMS